jgi:hypothetical protein
MDFVPQKDIMIPEQRPFVKLRRKAIPGLEKKASFPAIIRPQYHAFSLMLRDRETFKSLKDLQRGSEKAR